MACVETSMQVLPHSIDRVWQLRRRLLSATLDAWLQGKISEQEARERLSVGNITELIDTVIARLPHPGDA